MIVFLAALLAATPSARTPGPEAVVLGVAQDGGVPHAGCRQPLCVEARRDPGRHRSVASLGLLDPASGKRFLIDATPDFAAQMETLGGLPDGILLTHAHIGHYLGLAQLGREVLGARRVPVYCTKSMAKFLRENRPWSRLVDLENIVLVEIEPDVEFSLAPDLAVTAIEVPHRDEDSDTVAFLIRGPDASILWLPDIDRWDRWDRRLPDFFSGTPLTAFVDGTFFSADEIPGRPQTDIPHPLVPTTVAIVAAHPAMRGRVFLVHLNHTNRLYWDEDAREEIARKGVAIASEGQRISLQGRTAGNGLAGNMNP
jgi:pyrroloquinoline quinone biosynthesis protein B